MRIYLQTIGQTDGPTRFCQLVIQKDMLGGWNLIKESGYQGSAGRVVRDHFDTWEAAEQALAQHRDKHLQRGYRIVYVQGQQFPSEKS